jgi:hypothetical protein
MSTRIKWRLAVLALMVLRANAAEKPQAQVTMTLPSGIGVATSTYYDPAEFPPGHDHGVGGIVDGQIFHRYFWLGRRYFGYDVEVQAAGAKKFRLLIEPLSVDWEMLGRLGPGGLKTPAPLPQYPAPQVVDEGDEIQLDLAENPATGHKIVDHIVLRYQHAPAQKAPHDLQVSEIPLSLSKPALLVDGQVSGAPGRARSNGPILAVPLQDQGWAYLSLEPHAGYAFQKAGTISGSRVQFTAGGHQYELRSRDYVLPKELSNAECNVYVLLDPKAPLADGESKFRAGTLAEMLPRR